MNIEIAHKSISKTNPAKVILTIKNAEDGSLLDSNQIDLSNKEKRNAFIKGLVKDYPGLDSDDISERLLKITNDLLTKPDDDPDDSKNTPIETPLVLSEKALAETDADLVDAAMNLLKSPELIKFVLRHISDLGVVGEHDLILALYLTNTSRLLLKPLAVLVLGASSSGKSFAISIISKLFPLESVFQAHRITPAALQYLPAGSLIHRAVVAGERSRNTEDDAAEATRALREMISDGILRIAVTGKNEKGNLTTYHIEQPGPISYIESTTLGSGEIFDEDKTRFILLCADESEDQSKAIMARMAADAAEPKHNEDIESIIALHHTMQRLLKSREVIIPFAGELTAAMPCRRPESRRAFGHLLNLIRAVALLHQYQREVDAAGRIIATITDYDIVRTHLSLAIGRGLGVVLSAGADSLLDIIENAYNVGDKFTVAELKEITGLGRIVYDRLKELRYHGYLKMEPGSGNQGAKYELSPVPAGAPGFDLPEIKLLNSIPAANVHANSQEAI